MPRGVSFVGLIAFVGILTIGPRTTAAPLRPVAITNGDFRQGAQDDGVPIGWQRYAGSASARLAFDAAEAAVILDDQDPAAEIGIMQTFAIQPQEGYEVRVEVRAFPDRSTAGAYLQFRFLPSNQFTQVPLYTESVAEWEEIAVRGFAPPDTKQATIYLYTHRDPTPKLMIRNVRVFAGAEPPPPPPPEPVPPVYEKLKDLHREIPLVENGQATIRIVIGRGKADKEAAEKIAAAIRVQTGVSVPIIPDTDPAAAVPLVGHLIVLGNRSTNKTSNALYDHYYSLMDLKYPGPEGYAIRSLHNPYGNGYSAILVGASDELGLRDGADVLARIIRQTKASGRSLRLGWLMETRLGKGYKIPTDIREFETWEASKGYGSVGYFGWNSLSKRMAMYYMTGDPFHAREFIRLAFPDAQAQKEIATIDEERVENKKDPLAGPYHYNAMMLILYWDLIEESPVFTDEERLKVTNAFARRLAHPQDRETYFLNDVPAGVSSRHGQWSALSLYTLARYFQKYYPSPVWAQAERAGRLAFASLHQHAWVSGENDNLFWYNTAIAPILTYLILTGDRKPIENGVLQTLLRGQEILISGRIPDWALQYAALDFLHKAAYLTGDGRWIVYRERTGLDTNIFRLGQSFWPDASLTPQPPLDLVGKWTIHPMPKPMWRARATGFRLDESFQFGSFRSAPDASGDFILLDGYNGASRNPYHTFPVLEYRLNGRTLLQGYMNQVLTSADGMWEPRVPMDAQLLYRDVLGPMAVAVGQVPHMPFCAWQRFIAHHTGRYGLFVDDLTFRTDSENMKVSTVWQLVNGVWNDKEQAARMAGQGMPVNLPGWLVWRALNTKCQTNPPTPDKIALLDSLGTVLLRGRAPGEWLEMPFTVEKAVSGELFADMLSYNDRGVARFYLDGRQIGPEFDNWAEEVAETRVSMGRVDLQPGLHRLRVEVVRAHPGVSLMNIGLRGLSLKTPQAADAPPPAYFELRPSTVQETTTTDGVLTMNWEGPVRQGEHRIAFYLFGQGREGQPLACLQIAPNAAALRLPTPALASVGEFAQNKAALAIVAADHLYGHNLTAAGVDKPLVQADSPVDLYWDFVSGRLYVVTNAETRLRLRLAAGAKLMAAGKPLPTTSAEGLTSVPLPAGRHEIVGAKPAAVAEAAWTALLQRGAEARAEALAQAQAPSSPPTGEAWTPAMRAQVGSKISSLAVMNMRRGPRIAVAADDKIIHVLAPDGQPVWRAETTGAIRNLHWWATPQLLLAGCVDEKLYAYDPEGRLKWTFVSEMDPAVYEAAKQYWFKSAHPGIYGIGSGLFWHGQEQCFIGSACTLEMVDAAGKLVKRMPLFWGPGSVFQLLPRPDGSIELLVAREPTDGHYLYAVSNKDFSTRRGWDGVPSGHTYVGGWANMSRDHIFHVDLDGDGKKEIVSEINGVWNRVTVWDEDGNALYNAQFGPGSPIPVRNMRDLDIIDLDGDGRCEIIAATSAGLVVALDCRLQKRWARRLSSPPTVLMAVTSQGAPTLIVGCENGDLLQLNSQGQIGRRGQVEGTPNKIASLTTDGRSLAIVTTTKGVVVGFPY